MASNFDFLKKVDNELFLIVEDGEKLFRDEYFNQAVVQFRIYAEKMAKKILNSDNKELTFDTVLNNLKDKIKTQREKEFIDDLFFIKKEGNACAHGEDATAIKTLEVIRHAFEAGINYAYAKNKDENIDKLIFDETLLITQKSKEKETLTNKYLEKLENESKETLIENLLNEKQGEFLSSVDKTTDENNIKDRNRISDPSQYKKQKRKKKELTPKELKIKEKIKEARKNIKKNINKEEKPKPQKEKNKKQQNKIKKTTPKKERKSSKKNQDKDYGTIKALLFILFVIASVILLLKMMI